MMAGCSPEVGSPKWCESMKEKPKGDWSVNEAAEFAKNCILGIGSEVGSEKWCESMKEKPKGDWSANEAAEFAKNCVLGSN